MDDAVRTVLEIAEDAPGRAHTVDITTTGAKSGEARRIEIWFYRVDGEYFLSRSPGLPTPAWYVNLVANPGFTFHLKNGAEADLPAMAHVITEPAERERIFTGIVAQLEHAMGPDRSGVHSQPTQAWVASSPLIRIEFA